MSESIIVTFEQKRYTWDGQRWYGTDDYLVPTMGTARKLAAMLPKPPVEKAKPAARTRR